MKLAALFLIVAMAVWCACVDVTGPNAGPVCTIVIDLETGQAGVIDSLSTWDCLKNGKITQDTIWVSK
jgi:hypothetical protein